AAPFERPGATGLRLREPFCRLRRQAMPEPQILACAGQNCGDQSLHRLEIFAFHFHHRVEELCHSTCCTLWVKLLYHDRITSNASSSCTCDSAWICITDKHASAQTNFLVAHCVSRRSSPGANAVAKSISSPPW